MTQVEEKQSRTSRKIDPGAEYPVIADSQTFATVTAQISSIVLTRGTPLFWWCAFSFGLFLFVVFGISISWLLTKGVGIFGIEIPVAWGFAITNFVWWIGIGHAGTLISAILLLLRQSWRNSINRFAEAMTLFAVACAGMFPLIHLGRPWIFYWLLPYPNTMTVQPQFRSPLVWDVFAVSTYAIVSLLFWYLGIIPDLASVRDRATNRWKYAIYAVLALGWRGASKHWRFHETASLLLAGLATPLVLSVHTVVSFDFTIAILPGWHSTIFPPYFVAGAIYSGFAMVLVLCIPIRAVYGLHNLITLRHLDNCAKLMLATGLVLAYTYVIEPYTAWYSGDLYEWHVVVNRATGPAAWSYWVVILFNVAIPQALWFKKVRITPQPLFFVSMVVLIGMWLERFMIIITSLDQDFLPSSWSNFVATIWDNSTFFGSVGLFIVLFFLFVRFLPMISMYEVRELLPFLQTWRGIGQMSRKIPLYGVAAEFDDPETLLEAARYTREQGYRWIEAYTPYPIKELDEVIRAFNPLPAMVFVGGALGAATAWSMQYYIAAIDYPINVGGRPLYSWPSFIVILFELTVLFAAATAFFGMLGLAGLPRPNHPMFNVDRFKGVSDDRFFLCIEARRATFDSEAAASVLSRFEPVEVWEIENS